MCSKNIHFATSSHIELREPTRPEKVSRLANETLVEVLKYLNFKELIKAQAVCSKWSKVTENHRHELASPFISTFTLVCFSNCMDCLTFVFRTQRWLAQDLCSLSHNDRNAWINADRNHGYFLNLLG